MFHRFGGKRRLRFQIPVQLILPYPVVFALSLRRVGAGVKEPEVYDRRFAVGTVDEQIIVAFTPVTLPADARHPG